MSEGRKIREAQETDFQFVSDLMDHALAPYYDGDHRAHAARIFETHICGGNDHVGHFSAEQRMFILVDGTTQIGMVHIVRKRQGTWKISPLIITPAFQAQSGCGSELTAHAEQYARERGARQIYCTVAEQNHSAISFFRKKGYIPAGRSHSHYKPGVTEIMLYKTLSTEVDEEMPDKQSISVLPFEEHHRDGIYQLILNGTFPNYFRGVDQQWVDALFEGYRRRSTGEVNLKFKLIFVAVDCTNIVRGVAGATPKKGQPIKLMPCVASDPDAFAAMITDLPNYLRPYGRKLYTHLVPTVAETIILQRRGWSLDAIMPAAYHEDHCTQQWGYYLEDIMPKTIRVKRPFYLDIMSGRKTLEVRVGYNNIRSIRAGECIQLETSDASGIITVRAVRQYASFESMLAVEDAGKIVPGQVKA